MVTEPYGLMAATRVLEAYKEALRECSQMCVISSAVTIIRAISMEWKSAKKNKEDGKTEDEASEKFNSG